MLGGVCGSARGGGDERFGGARGEGVDPKVGVRGVAPLLCNVRGEHSRVGVGREVTGGRQQTPNVSKERAGSADLGVLGIKEDVLEVRRYLETRPIESCTARLQQKAVSSTRRE